MEVEAESRADADMSSRNTWCNGLGIPTDSGSNFLRDSRQSHADLSLAILWSLELIIQIIHCIHNYKDDFQMSRLFRFNRKFSSLMGCRKDLENAMQIKCNVVSHCCPFF